MPPSYFQGLKWYQITREERVFCAELHHLIRPNPEAFVSLLKKTANVPDYLSGPWDTAYEACFYRDYLHAFNPSQKRNYSPKRTFDIALFSNEAVIIIEAKVAQAFSAYQSRHFEADVQNIRNLLGEKVEVVFVALATQEYFDNYERYGRGPALAPFENRRLTWQAVADLYPHSPVLRRACSIYGQVSVESADNEPLPEWLDLKYSEADIPYLEEHIERLQRAIGLLRRRKSS